MSTGYFNTANLAGTALKEAVQKAKSQDDAIYLIYSNTGKAWSPTQIQGMVERAGYRWPIVSVRRSITSLTKKGKLIKTREQVKSSYGALEYQWQVKPKAA